MTRTIEINVKLKERYSIISFVIDGVYRVYVSQRSGSRPGGRTHASRLFLHRYSALCPGSPRYVVVHHGGSGVTADQRDGTQFTSYWRPLSN